MLMACDIRKGYQNVRFFLVIYFLNGGKAICFMNKSARYATYNYNTNETSTVFSSGDRKFCPVPDCS